MVTTAMPASSLTSAFVQPWLTLPDRSQTLAAQPVLPWQPAAPGGVATITIDPGLHYQVMQGFGAAMSESSAWLLMNVLDAPQRAAAIASLFGADGIRLSYVRIPMGASDFALGDYSYADLPAGHTDPELHSFSIARDRLAVIPALKLARAANPALRLMGSPWSAPAWMKASGSLHGGSLLPEFYPAFARYHVKFVQAYQAEGLPIDSLTLQNEPLLSLETYPTMLIPAAAQAELVRDHVGPALRRAGLVTRLLILDHNWDLWETPVQVLADPAAAAYVDGVAFHCYAGDVSLQSQVHAAHPDKGIWFTECSGGGWATDFAGNLGWFMRNLVIGNFRNWGNSLILWNLALDEHDGPQNGGCPNCRGVITIRQDTGAVSFNEEYFVLGHVSKFVAPGARRIESQGGAAADLEHVAFQNPDGSLALIVYAALETEFNVDCQGQRFTYRLPAGAAVTFHWQLPG